VWLLLLVVAALLVNPSEADKLSDPNDFELVTNWLVGELCKRVQEATAWDLTQQALTDSMREGPRPWEPTEITLAKHLIYVVSDLRHNEVRRMDFRVAADPEDDAPNVVRAVLTDPETYAVRNERRLRIYADARRHFETSPMVLRVLERAFLGEYPTTEEHAADLGLSLKQMYNARDRVVAYVRDWRAQEGEKGEAKQA
jgi:hypothetical protein